MLMGNNLLLDVSKMSKHLCSLQQNCTIAWHGSIAFERMDHLSKVKYVIKIVN